MFDVSLQEGTSKRIIRSCFLGSYHPSIWGGHEFPLRQTAAAARKVREKNSRTFRMQKYLPKIEVILYNFLPHFKNRIIHPQNNNPPLRFVLVPIRLKWKEGPYFLQESSIFEAKKHLSTSDRQKKQTKGCIFHHHHHQESSSLEASTHPPSSTIIHHHPPLTMFRKIIIIF